MTEDEKAATIAALLRERRGYLVKGDDGGVADVDAALRRLGHAAVKPSQRAEVRPAPQVEKSTR